MRTVTRDSRPTRARALDLQQVLDVRVQSTVRSQRLDQGPQLAFAVCVLLVGEAVVDPAELAPRLHDPRSAKETELPRRVGLGEPERGFDMADAQLTVRQEGHDAQPRLVSERLEEAGDGLHVQGVEAD